MPCFYSHEIIKGELQDQSAFCTYLEATNNTLICLALCECPIFVTHTSAAQHGLPDCPWAALDLGKDVTRVLLHSTLRQAWAPESVGSKDSTAAYWPRATSNLTGCCQNSMSLCFFICKYGNKTYIIAVLCQKLLAHGVSPQKSYSLTSSYLCFHHSSTISAWNLVLIVLVLLWEKVPNKIIHA